MSRRKIKRGDRVKVIRAADETLPGELHGLHGRVTGFNANNMTENSSTDPLIIVKFAKRIWLEREHGVITWVNSYEFWREELRVLP